MSKRILSCLVLLVLFNLQGIAQASVAAHAESARQAHCADHATSPEGCSCCPDELALYAGCASLCSMIAALPTMSIHVHGSAIREYHSLVVRESSGPSYIPLNPPPIF
jgi:hypothetical protein